MGSSILTRFCLKSRLWHSSSSHTVSRRWSLRSYSIFPWLIRSIASVPCCLYNHKRMHMCLRNVERAHLT